MKGHTQPSGSCKTLWSYCCQWIAGLHLLFVPPTILCFSEFPLGFAPHVFETLVLWMWCHITLPFYKGIVLFFQKLVDLLIVLIKPVLVDPCPWPKNSFADSMPICLKWVYFSFGSPVSATWTCSVLLRSEWNCSLLPVCSNLVVLNVAQVRFSFWQCMGTMWRPKKDLTSLWSVQNSAPHMALMLLTSRMSCL